MDQDFAQREIPPLKRPLLVAPVPVRPLSGYHGYSFAGYWPWPVLPASLTHHQQQTQWNLTQQNQTHIRIRSSSSRNDIRIGGGGASSIFPYRCGAKKDYNFFLPFPSGGKTSPPPRFDDKTVLGFGTNGDKIVFGFEESRNEFRCSHCRKDYSSAPAYHMHMRTHAQGCECPICGKSFSRHWLLQGHIRTHTGEKPFRCQVCSKAFADKSNLRAHVQTHSGVKPFVCGRCGKAFALKSYLSKHEESACVKSAG